MTDMKPNAELAYRVLDHIDAHPESWDQTTWLRRTDRGTAACFAGWACLLSGDQPAWDDRETPGAVQDYIMDRSHSRKHVGDRAIEDLLNISYDQAEDLFAAENDRETLGELVETFFGPRPDAQR